MAESQRRRFPSPTTVTSVAAALSLAAMAGTAGFLVGRFPLLTPYLPVHFRRGGIADRWQPKSWALVLMPVWVQLSLAVVVGAIVLVLLWRAAPDTPAADREHLDDDARRMRAAAEGIALLGVVWIAFQALAAVQLVGLWQRGWGGLGGRYGLGVLTAIGLSVIIGIRSLARVGWAPRLRDGHEEGACWRLKVLYVNPADPALFVPARWGMSWTLNFGRPAAVVLIALALLVGIGAPVVIVRLLTW